MVWPTMTLITFKCRKCRRKDTWTHLSKAGVWEDTSTKDLYIVWICPLCGAINKKETDYVTEDIAEYLTHEE